MTAAAAPVQAPVRINYDALGAFYWNPHPYGPKGLMEEHNGIKYPYGTKVVIVCGKHYAFYPQAMGHVDANNPHFSLIIRNLEIIVGESSRNDSGLRRVDLARLDKEKEVYLEELDKNGKNILLETLRETVLENFRRENETRLQHRIPAREMTHAENMAVELMNVMAETLDQKGAHELKEQIKGIRKAAAEPPPFFAELRKLGIGALKKKAAQMGALVRGNPGKEEIIRIIAEHSAAQVLEQTQAAAGDFPVPGAETGDGGSDGEDEKDGEEAE